MKRTLIATVAFIMTVGVASAAAQQGPRPGGELSGRILSAGEGEPIAGASVAVWSPADSAIVTGAVVREDGAFHIQGVPPGTYFIRVSSIGYAAHTSDPFTLSPASPRVNMGDIRLATSVVEADEIQVTVERPTVMLEPDRNSYSAAEVAPGAASATDVLENVPSVQVDTDGKVSLRGNENVAVHINGRPSPVRGDQLAGFLQQLPANGIDRIEVIPTPSARHDPEGMAGIINIVMKQNADLGTSGGLTVGAATAERYNLAGNVGYQRGPVTLFTTYGYNSNERNSSGFNNRQRLDSTGDPLSFTEQDVSGENGMEGHNLTNTLEYRLGERDVLSSSLTLNRRTSTELSSNVYTELDASREVVDLYARPRDSDDESMTIDHTLAFRRTYEPRQHELSAEFRVNRSTDDDRTLLWRVPADAPQTRLELESNRVDAVNDELVAQIDYTRPLGEKNKLEAGYKGTSRRIDQDFTVLEDPLGAGEWQPSDFSNAFEFDETVQAVYGVVSRGVGNVQLQGGLRAEYASQDFALSDESFPNDYTSLFPSGIVSWSPNENNQYKISYTRRIRRPGTNQLNPFPRFMDPQNVFIGNPQLDPEYTDAVEIGYTRSGNLGQLQVTPFYRHTTDIIRFIVDTDAVVDGREVTSVSFENLASSDSWGTDVNGSFELGEWFDGFASFNVFKQVTDGGSVTSLSSDAVTWSARVNGTAQLNPSLSLQAMAFYRAPMEFETGKFSSFKFSALTLRQKLFDDRASLSLRLQDPFKTMGFRVETGDENIFQVTEREFDSRSLQLTFQYNFGQAPRVRQPRPQGPSDGDDSGGFPQ